MIFVLSAQIWNNIIIIFLMGYTIPVSFIMESYVLIDLIVSNLGKITVILLEVILKHIVFILWDYSSYKVFNYKIVIKE